MVSVDCGPDIRRSWGEDQWRTESVCDDAIQFTLLTVVVLLTSTAGRRACMHEFFIFQQFDTSSIREPSGTGDTRVHFTRNDSQQSRSDYSDVNKDITPKAKDTNLKAKAKATTPKAKDSTLKAKIKDVTVEGKKFKNN